MMRISKIFVFAALGLLTCACGPEERKLPPVEPTNVPRYASNIQYTSAMLGTVLAFDILLPEGYVQDTDKRYPVVYCFHGYGNDNTSWNNEYLKLEQKVKAAESKGMTPMIFVIPNGLKSYFCDNYSGSYPYMTMIAEEFIPYIDKTYRTLADKQHRAVMGYSMGAFGALATAMQHTDMFCASAGLSISRRTDEQYMTESQSAWNNQWGRIFGGSGTTGKDRLTDYYKSLCPLHQFTAENKAKYSQVQWFVTCGDNEKTLLYGNDDLHVMMLTNGYAHEYRVGEGGHSESYWNTALEEVLPWLSYVMDGGSDWEQQLLEVNVPTDFTPSADGVFESEGYKSASTGKAIYMFYNGIDKSWINDAVGILQRGISLKKFVILPCDTSVKSVGEWVAQYSGQYSFAASQAIALGSAGGPVLQGQDHFTTLYFDNAEIDYKMDVSKSVFYYLGQCDSNPHCADLNALYKACKEADAGFNYRCRNHNSDARLDFLAGIEYIKLNLKDI